MCVFHVTPRGQRTLVGVATQNHAPCLGSPEASISTIKTFLTEVEL